MHGGSALGFCTSLPAGPFQAGGDRSHIPAAQSFLQTSMTLSWLPSSFSLCPPVVDGAVDRAALALALQVQPPGWAGRLLPMPSCDRPLTSSSQPRGPQDSPPVACTPATHLGRVRAATSFDHFHGRLRQGLGRAGPRMGRSPGTSCAVTGGRWTTRESKCSPAVSAQYAARCWFASAYLRPSALPLALTSPDPLHSPAQGRNQEP